MKFLLAIALFCLASEAVSVRSMNAMENAPSRSVDFYETREELFKHPKRFVRNKGRVLNLKQSRSHDRADIGSLRPNNIHQDGQRYFKARSRKSETENVIQPTDFNGTTESKSRANLTNLFNVDPDLTMLKSLVTDRTKVSIQPAEEEATEVATVKKKRIHPHGRLAGRAKASCDSCSSGTNGNGNGNAGGATECPSNLENMFVCPKCRTHFVVKINIKESKGCE